MKVVLDSNVLLVAVGRRSRYRPLWQFFLQGRYELITTDEILNEYEEILDEHGAPGSAEAVLGILKESTDVDHHSIFYHWNAIPFDSDDNKFFDAAVAANADYLVTNDAHFNEAKKLSFPKINIVSADEFLSLL